MLRRILAFAAILVVTLPLASHAQMTSRLKGTVKDSDGKPSPEPASARTH